MQDLVLLDFFWVVKILVIVGASIVTIVAFSVGYINLAIFIESHPAGELVRNFTNRLRKAFRKNIPEEGKHQVESIENTSDPPQVHQLNSYNMKDSSEVKTETSNDPRNLASIILVPLLAGMLTAVGIHEYGRVRSKAADVNPAAVSTDGCEGAINDGMNCNQPLNCYVDADNDGYGTGAVIPTYTACPAGTSLVQGDSDDQDAFVR